MTTTPKPSSATATATPPKSAAATTAAATPVLNSSSETSADDAALLAAAAAAARAQTPRPIFPWRHEPLDHPLPRLTPGTPEHALDNAVRMGGWAERSLAYWFLGVPPLQALFRFGKWKREFAELSAYAFTQAVAGIVSNTYRIPLEELISNTDDEDNPKVHFKFPLNIDLPFTPTKEHQNNSGEPQTEETKNKNNKDTVNSADKKGEGSSDTSEPPPASTEESKFNSNPNTGDQHLDKKDNSAGTTENHPVDGGNVEAEKSVAKDDVHVKQKTVDSSKKNPDPKAETKFCPEVQDMMIPRLRNLFQSAHESGKDQLIIHLRMEPIHAYFYNIFCLPYMTRDLAEKDPDRIKMLRRLKIMKPREGIGKVVETLDSDLARKGRLETTVEVQVLIICNEVFQVLDRTTGAVLQGSKDGSVQTVCHVVRMENTALQVLPEDGKGSQLTTSNWQITDIDDLLDGPIAWYQK
jgi:hypothetical protein